MEKLMNALLENIFINCYEKEKQLGVMVIEFLFWSPSSPLFFSLLMFVYVQLIMQNVHAFCRIANPQKKKKFQAFCGNANQKYPLLGINNLRN